MSSGKHPLKTLEWRVDAYPRRRVAKGNKVVIPILAMNRSAEIWGEDSLEFRYAHSEALFDCTR